MYSKVIARIQDLKPCSIILLDKTLEKISLAHFSHF